MSHACNTYSDGNVCKRIADVLVYILEGDRSVVIKPSVIEPKVKAYLSVGADNREVAEALEKNIVSDVERLMK